MQLSHKTRICATFCIVERGESYVCRCWRLCVGVTHQQIFCISPALFPFYLGRSRIFPGRKIEWMLLHRLPVNHHHSHTFFFLAGVLSHSSGHQADATQTSNPIKPEPVQSNGPSHPVAEAPPPLPDSNSNGCSEPSHDQNGSLEPPVDLKETAAVQERPAKRCRVEAEPLGQSEVEPSRTQEN